MISLSIQGISIHSTFIILFNPKDMSSIIETLEHGGVFFIRACYKAILRLLFFVVAFTIRWYEYCNTIVFIINAVIFDRPHFVDQGYFWIKMHNVPLSFFYNILMSKHAENSVKQNVLYSIWCHNMYLSLPTKQHKLPKHIMAASIKRACGDLPVIVFACGS